MPQNARDSTQLQKILIATDFSPASARARDYALALANRGATLWFMHAYGHAREDVLDRTYVPDWLAEPGNRQDSRDRLRLFAAPARAAGFSVEMLVREARSADLILAQAASLRPDLIVLGTHGRRGFERSLMGSTAERVVRLAPVPVLMAPAQGPSPDAGVRTILCPLGLMANAPALAFASAVADRCGSALTVLHVLQHPLGQALSGSRSRWTHERLAQALQAIGGPHASHLVRHGEPAREILRVAVERAADVIVMGAHERLAGPGGPFGSTAGQVLREASCAVITVPPASEHATTPVHANEPRAVGREHETALAKGVHASS